MMNCPLLLSSHSIQGETHSSRVPAELLGAGPPSCHPAPGLPGLLLHRQTEGLPAGEAGQARPGANQDQGTFLQVNMDSPTNMYLGARKKCGFIRGVLYALQRQLFVSCPNNTHILIRF